MWLQEPKAMIYCYGVRFQCADHSMARDYCKIEYWVLFLAHTDVFTCIYNTMECYESKLNVTWICKWIICKMITGHTCWSLDMQLTCHIKFCTCNNSTPKSILACVDVHKFDEQNSNTKLHELCKSFCRNWNLNEWVFSPQKPCTFKFVISIKLFHRDTLSIQLCVVQKFWPTFSMYVFPGCCFKYVLFSRFLEVAMALSNVLDNVYNDGYAPEFNI